MVMFFGSQTVTLPVARPIDIKRWGGYKINGHEDWTKSNSIYTTQQ
jgi:hypothetical protein